MSSVEVIITNGTKIKQFSHLCMYNDAPFYSQLSDQLINGNLHLHSPYCAHLGELIHRLEPMVNTLGQELCKLLVVEDLERTARRYFTNCTWMKTMVVVTVSRLHKDGTV